MAPNLQYHKWFLQQRINHVCHIQQIRYMFDAVSQSGQQALEGKQGVRRGLTQVLKVPGVVPRYQKVLGVWDPISFTTKFGAASLVLVLALAQDSSKHISTNASTSANRCTCARTVLTSLKQGLHYQYLQQQYELGRHYQYLQQYQLELHYQLGEGGSGVHARPRHSLSVACKRESKRFKYLLSFNTDIYGWFSCGGDALTQASSVQYVHIWQKPIKKEIHKIVLIFSVKISITVEMLIYVKHGMIW